MPEWREFATSWLRDHGALLLIVDTATGATQVDPWGRAIQEVYAGLRAMLAEYPALAIVLLIHLRKPSGRVRISDETDHPFRSNPISRFGVFDHPPEGGRGGLT